MRTVTIAEETIPQYRVPLFDGLRRTLEGHRVHLRVAHGRPARNFAQRLDAPGLAWGEPLPQCNFRFRDHELVWLDCRRAIRKTDLVIVSQELRLVSNLALWALQEVGCIRLGLWGHGRDFSKPSDRNLTERLKRAMSRRPHWWFAYNQLSARTVSGFGYPEERISILMNSTDTELLRETRTGMGPDQIQELRQRSGIGEGPVGLYLGAMDPIKRLPYLLEAARYIRRTLPTFELMMIGAGPELPALRETTDGDPWIHWIPPQFGQAKARFMMLADVCLIPAWVGLGIVDAFALGLPLVTTDAFPHSVEIDYLEHDTNGWMVSGRPTPRDYGEAVAGLLQAPGKLEHLRRGCLASAERLTMPAMVDRFAEGILRALEAPPLGARSSR